MIPVKPGVALSWKPICHGSGASFKLVFKNKYVFRFYQIK